MCPGTSWWFTGPSNTMECNNNNDNNDHTDRRNLRFVTISSLHCELSPTRTLKWPGRNRVRITCNTCRPWSGMLLPHWVQWDIGECVQSHNYQHTLVYRTHCTVWLERCSNLSNLAPVDSMQSHSLHVLVYHTHCNMCLYRP